MTGVVERATGVMLSAPRTGWAASQGMGLFKVYVISTSCHLSEAIGLSSSVLAAYRDFSPRANLYAKHLHAAEWPCVCRTPALPLPLASSQPPSLCPCSTQECLTCLQIPSWQKP